MLACVVAGRPVLTDPQQVDPTHFVFPLHDPQNIDAVCVFLTTPLPPELGATVHLIWPSRGLADQFLGVFTNERPSAIFRIRASPASTSSAAPALAPALEGPAVDVSDLAYLGIVVEPLSAVAAQAAQIASPEVSTADRPQDALILAERIVKHLFNYLSSFSPNPTASLTANTSVPIGLVTKWSESFLNKLRTGGTAFLSRTD